ncbi:MAG: GGDEF domain-containing protein, partial [bacterium]|nr:GGDEF domain-containing protein [bacterium]
MKLNITLLFACLLLWIPVDCLALDPGRPLDQYAVSSRFLEAGLPQSSVLSIHQTPDGYLWFGTYEGLARFNGVSFAVFDKTNTPQIKNNGMYDILHDRRGNLWIA